MRERTGRGDEEEEERRGGRIIEAFFIRIPLFEGEERRRGTRRRRETRRKRDKGMKERRLISRDSDQTEEAKQTEKRGLLRVMFRLTAAHSPGFRRLSCFLLLPERARLLSSEHQPSSNGL